MSIPFPAAGAVRPYGDTPDDGMVQLSFTLPLPHGPRAEGAALQLAGRMGMERPLLVHSTAVGGTDFSFFVVYGAVTHAVDLDEVTVAERDYPLLSAKEADQVVAGRLGRRLVVIGACIGTDAHTVGIDAILNIKGFAGEKGLEYYKQLRVINLGAQVPVGDLVRAARAERADAVLVSQAVTQKDAHLTNVRELSAELRAEFADDERPLLVVGGPRFDARSAQTLGADRVFGRGTTPGDVASYLVHALAVAPPRAAGADVPAVPARSAGSAGSAVPAGSDGSAVLQGVG
ncbi:OAM dimerization domain-containing protein [Streptomyces sp. OZ13]|uniref:lysine 5,6-aminomutase subunit beta n=1 Tax=Streptomyces sp. OZ13 TaxID=3452210 RepID=UPI003F8BD36E